MPEFRAVYFGSTLVDTQWTQNATHEYISRVRKQSNKPVKVRLVVTAEGIQVIDRETGDVIQHAPLGAVAHNEAGNQQFIYTTISRAGTMYCHVLAVKENASDIPACISRESGGRGPASRARPTVDGSNNFSLDSPPTGTPHIASASSSTRSMSTRKLPPPPTEHISSIAPTKSIRRTEGMHSSMSALPTPPPTAPLTRSASADVNDAAKTWSQKFDALYLGAEAVSSADMEGVRAAMARSEEHRKSIDALRKQMGSKKEFEGDPVQLVVSSNAVRIEERVTGEALQTDFIKTINFTGSLPNKKHELFAYISSDARQGRINCYLFNVDAGKSKDISRAITIALERQTEEEKKAKAANPFAVTDPTREPAPPALFQRQIHRADLTAIDCIGSGQFGSVYIAHQKVPPGRGDGGGMLRSRAVKLLRNAATQDDKKQFIHEAEVMLQMSHPNVVRMIGVAIQQKPWLCVLEFMFYGDLRGALLGCKEKGIVLDVGEFLYFSQQLSSGCAYIASKGFVHMDLAARNCMLTEKNIVKVGDFGLTRPVLPGKDYFILGDNVRLPVRWIALEGFTHKMFSEKSDVWSLAITIWEIFTYGDLPYKKHRTQDVPRRVYDGDRVEMPATMIPELWPTLLRCWEKSPADRPTFTHLTDVISQLLETRMVEDQRDLGALLQSSRRKASVSNGPPPPVKRPVQTPAPIPETAATNHTKTLERKKNHDVPEKCPVCGLALRDHMSAASAQIHLQTCENAKMDSAPTETAEQFGFEDEPVVAPTPTPTPTPIIPTPTPVVQAPPPPAPTPTSSKSFKKQKEKGKTPTQTSSSSSQHNDEDDLEVDEDIFQPKEEEHEHFIPQKAPSPENDPEPDTPPPPPPPSIVRPPQPSAPAPTIAAPIAVAAAPIAAPVQPAALTEAQQRAQQLEVSEKAAALMKVRQSNTGMFGDGGGPGGRKHSKIFEALNPQSLAFQTAKDRADAEESDKVDLGRLGERRGGGGGGGGFMGMSEEDEMDLLMSMDARIAAAQEAEEGGEQKTTEEDDDAPQEEEKLDPNNLPEFDDEMRKYMKAMRDQRAQAELDKRAKLKAEWEEKKRKEKEAMDATLAEISRAEAILAKRRETSDLMVAETQARLESELDFSAFRFSF